MPLFASAQVSTTSDTVFLQVNKLVSPAHFGGVLNASDFSFTITGNGVNQVVNHAGIIELEVGAYSITESYGGSDSIGFNPLDWTVLWSGTAEICYSPEHDMSAGEPGPILVEAEDIGRYTAANPARCSAHNQFKPGTLQVTKVVVGTSTTPDNFSFTINGGTAIAFDSSGSNDIDVPAGSFEIVEEPVSGYTTTYEGCSGTVANNEKVQCTITNTLTSSIPTPVPGCTDPLATNYNSLATQGDGSCLYPSASSATGTLVVIVQVINDDGGVATTSDFSFLINGGTSTPSNGSGINSYVVATGTYNVLGEAASGYTTTYNNCTNSIVSEGAVTTCTITYDDTNGGGGSGSSDPETYRVEGYVWHDDNENTQWDGFENENPTEDEQSGWTVEITNGSSTFSTQTDESGYYSFEVEAGTWTITEVVQDGWTLITPVAGSHVVTVPDAILTQSFSEKIIAFLIPTAHAAVLGTYGPFNFGNNESKTITTGGSKGSGGCRNCITSRGTSPTPPLDPVPQVLGDQVTLVPVGAPNAGAGGMAPTSTSLFDLFLLMGSVMALWGVRRYAA